MTARDNAKFLDGLAVDTHRPSPADDEIRLIDLWAILLKRKWWIVAAVLLMASAAIVVSAIMPARYESRAAIVIGQTDKQLLEQPDVLVERLKSVYGLTGDSPSQRQLPRLEHVRLRIRGSKAIVSLASVGGRPEEARSFLNDVVKDLTEQHRQQYDKVLQLQRDYLAALERQLRLTDSHLASLERQLKRLPESSVNESALLSIEHARLSSKRPELEADLMQVGLALLPPLTEPTRVLQSPTLAADPSRPRPVLYLGLGIGLGIALGVFAAFLAESLMTARSNVGSDNASVMQKRASQSSP